MDRYPQLSPRTVLLDPAGVVVLKSSRGRRFWVFFASLFLLATSVYVIAMNNDSWWGWVGVLFFFACLVLLVLQIVRPDLLRLTKDGFSYTTFGRRTSFQWSAVAEFGLLEYHGPSRAAKRVGIRYKERRSALTRTLTIPAGNFDAFLPDSYGLPVEDLIALMEEWRSVLDRASSA